MRRIFSHLDAKEAYLFLMLVDVGLAIASAKSYYRSTKRFAAVVNVFRKRLQLLWRVWISCRTLKRNLSPYRSANQDLQAYQGRNFGAETDGKKPSFVMAGTAPSNPVPFAEQKSPTATNSRLTTRRTIFMRVPSRRDQPVRGGA